MNIDNSEDIGSRIDDTIASDMKQGGDAYPEIGPGFTLSGRYRLDAKVGEGGMGQVFRGQDIKLARPIAIKLMKPKLSANREAVEMLRKEAQVSMMLSHPHIMRLINFEQDGKFTFLLMDFLPGKNLSDLRRNSPGGKLNARFAGMIGYEICKALEYAHKKNVIHRDIKPANIMIDDDLKSVKLMDFGIARTLMAGSGESPKIAGTLSYIAPEIFGGARPDQRSDIYALGLTLYELVSGINPFRGRIAQEVIDHLTDFVPAND